MYFDPGNLVRLAMEGGCKRDRVDDRRTGLRQPRVRPPPPVHRQAQPQPAAHVPQQLRPDHVRLRAARARARRGGVGATIYLGSPESRRQIVEVAEAFDDAHRRGMFTVLWCYLRNSAFVIDGTDYHLAADLTGQANHLGVTLEADIIKQKPPESNRGFAAAARSTAPTARRASSSTSA
jgi:fructose-bisphosphate aldolase, class I